MSRQPLLRPDRVRKLRKLRLQRLQRQQHQRRRMRRAPVSTSTCSSITDGTTEGPYYVTGTAELTDGNLNYDSLPGDAIAIAGYVDSGTAKTTPLANAAVGIW